MTRFVLFLFLAIFPSQLLAADDALDIVNAQRAARGLSPFIRDEGLSKAANDAADYRAKYRLFGHTSNDFQFLPSGATASAAGCAAYPAHYGFMACATYDSYTYAGAASAIGPDGKMYHHLFVSGPSFQRVATFQSSFQVSRRRFR